MEKNQNSINKKVSKTSRKGTPIWDDMDKEDKEKLQKALDETKFTKRMANLLESPFGQVLIELKNKYHADKFCMCCGRPTASSLGVCLNCKKKLVRTRDVDLGKEELEKFADATKPENLNWAFVDIETAQRIAKLFSPGEKLSWQQAQPILDAFAEQKKKIEAATGRPEQRLCLVCGTLTLSRTGLCTECRQFIREHGCVKPMKEGDFRTTRKDIEAYSRFSRAGLGKENVQNNDKLPLVKVR